jgi:hypothetical protein
MMQSHNYISAKPTYRHRKDNNVRRLFITKIKEKDTTKNYHLKLLDDNYRIDTVMEIDATQIEITYLSPPTEYIYVLVFAHGNMNRNSAITLLVDYIEQTWNESEAQKGGM